jgi:hypothetical protein
MDPWSSWASATDASPWRRRQEAGRWSAWMFLEPMLDLCRKRAKDAGVLERLT